MIYVFLIFWRLYWIFARFSPCGVSVYFSLRPCRCGFCDPHCNHRSFEDFGLFHNYLIFKRLIFYDNSLK